MANEPASGEGLYFLDRRSPPRVAVVKMVSTIRAHYFSGTFPKEKIYDDLELGQRILSLDLGHFFWRQKLDLGHLRQIVDAAEDGQPPELRALDHRSIADAAIALEVFGSVPSRMPDADELLFAYRVIQRLIEIANRGESGVQIHQARGPLSADFDTFDLAAVLTCAEQPAGTGLGRQLSGLLDLAVLPTSLEIVIINIRNDAEIAQAVIVAALLKRRLPSLKVILEAAGGNEQFDFSALVKPFATNASNLGKFVDYYLPKQDYRATLRPLLNMLLDGQTPGPTRLPNLLPLAATSSVAAALVAEDVKDAFLRHIRHSPPFYSAGRKTLLARLTPARCHWSACYFCTINTQHLVPGGTQDFDDTTAHYAMHLIDVLREKEIESLILTDEAIHPKVVEGFSRALLESGLNIVFRARSRFTDDLTPELCTTLYRSGCRYLGMGLESASPRVNALVNKHRGAAPDYCAILRNLEDAGVRPHIYSIMGFPTETLHEISETRSFLLRAIEEHHYVTVSANTFYLMRGSMIALRPERFGIQKVEERGDLRLVLEFEEDGRAERLQAARLAAGAVYQAQFLPFGEDIDFAEGFWHFIDQAGVFYVQKVERRRNPYRELAREFAAPAERVRSRFERPLSRNWLFELPPDGDEDEATICDWVTLNYARLPRAWAAIALAAADEPIAAGLRCLPVPEQQEAHECFVELQRAGFFSAPVVNCPVESRDLKLEFA
ncbi:MAG TPA: radical SAM protein [Allosphingosinicella sp.]|jgi:hypothetical protein